MSRSQRGRPFDSKILVPAIGFRASEARPETVSVGSATITPWCSNSTAALRSVEISVFTSAVWRRERSRIASCGMLPIFGAFFHPKWPESRRQEELRFSRRQFRLRVFQPESRQAFVPSKEASRVPLILTMGSAHPKPATKCGRRSLQPNAQPRRRRQ